MSSFWLVHVRSELADLSLALDLVVAQKLPSGVIREYSEFDDKK
jgi:hypothetical protein